MASYQVPTTNQLCHMLSFGYTLWSEWFSSRWQFLFEVQLFCNGGPQILSGHWWSLPSDPVEFPDKLGFFRRYPMALCPSFPHWKQYVQYSFSWDTWWHFLLASSFTCRFEMVVQVLSVAVFSTGVRAFSKFLVRDDTCAVSSWMATRLAWTSACIWTAFCFSLSCCTALTLITFCLWAWPNLFCLSIPSLADFVMSSRMKSSVTLGF